MANKDDEQILVVPSDIIFQKERWQGLKTDNLDYYLESIENNCQFKRRGDVEDDNSFQQIIPYMLFSFGNKFFAYKYIKNAGETRLINNDYQLGVGGHINKDDIRNGGNVLQEGMKREWEEEVDFKGNFLQRKLIGIINDESRPVEQVHLGLVYHFIGDSDDINVKETDKMEGRLFDLKDVGEKLSHSPWMQIVYDEYLKGLLIASANVSMDFSNHKKSAIKNIIFDWSGVIKDAFETQLWVVNRMFKKFGAREISYEEFKQNWEQPYMVFYNKYIPNLTKEDQDKAWLEAMLDKDCPKGRDYPGMVKLIRKLKVEKKFLAILTSEPAETIMAEIKKFELENIFNDIVIDAHDKTDGLEKIMKNNNLNLEETVFIGDSNHEVETGKEAGVGTIAVTWGFCPEDRLKSLNPDYLVHNAEELGKILLPVQTGNKERGKFFVFEGIDGCGKSTQTKLLAEYFRNKGYEVERIDFPQHGERSSAMVDDYLTGKYGTSEEVGPKIASIFYATDRYDASFKIKKWLAEGKIVVSDRYLVSNIGHQGGKIKDKQEWKDYVNWLYNLEYEIFKIPKPDHTFILKTSTEFSLKLVDSITDTEKLETKEKYLGGGKQDIHEKNKSHLENALSSYLMVAKEFPNDFKVIECLENGGLLPAVIINQKIIKIVEDLPAQAKDNKHMSTERRIYALPNNLMPEVKAVTFAKCSRSADAFDKIAAELTEEKSAEFNEKWVVGFGHSSIAEHAVISLAIENVSNIATKAIEDSRLASFTEKSSRYQIFNKDKLYMPEDIMNSELKETYLDAVNSLMDAYEQMTPKMMEFVKQKYPKPADQDEKLYNMISKARACDNLRYLLPSAVLTNLGMTINTRELENLIKKLLSHPMKEMQDIGREMKEKAMEAVPTLIKFANKNNYIFETKKQLKNIADWELGRDSGNNQAVTIVNYDRDALDKLITGILYPYSDLSYEEISKKVKNLSEDKKEKIIDETLKRRDKFDQPLRELEHIYYSFDILLDYGAFRDVQRHRMCTQSNQPVTVVHGYDLPPEIREAGFEEQFKTVVEKSVEAYNKIYEKFPEDAQYVVPMCFRKRVLITWNLRELHHFISLRSGKKGHASYRRIAQQCWRELNKIQPLLAKYIRVDMDEMNVSWAASLENKDFYYNPYAARKN